MDTDCEYTPRTRFCFSTKILLQDKLLIRDGGHYKVKDELLPKTYKLFIATLENIELHGDNITPKAFLERSRPLKYLLLKLK